MKTFFFLVCSFMLSGAAFSQDGAVLYNQKGCTACHGLNGAKPTIPTYPKLAGQNAQYLLLQMKEFKSGKRNGSQAALMKPFMMSLTDKEKKAIADYLSKVKN